MRALATPRVGNSVPSVDHNKLIDRRILGIGPAVVLTNWILDNTSDNSFSVAAGSQLNYLLNYAPHTDDDAISHRTEQVQLWYREAPMPWMTYGVF